MGNNSDFQSTWMARQPDFERTHVLHRSELSGTDRHRQYGEGTIVKKKKGDRIWWVLSVILIGGVVYTVYCPRWLMQLFS